MWYAQLANPLALWLASPVRLLSDYFPRMATPVASLSGKESEAGSVRTTRGSTSSGDSDGGSTNGSVDSKSTQVETSSMASSSNTSTSSCNVFERVGLIRPRAVEPAGVATLMGDTSTSDTTLAVDSSSSGKLSTLGSSCQPDPFTMETPRTGAQLGRGKFGSIRKLGTKLRKSVSLRRPRSASLNVGSRMDASPQCSPLRQQVLSGERPRASRTSTRSFSASMSLPHALDVGILNQSSRKWEYGLP